MNLFAPFLGLNCTLCRWVQGCCCCIEIKKSSVLVFCVCQLMKVSVLSSEAQGPLSLFMLCFFSSEPGQRLLAAWYLQLALPPHASVLTSILT